MVACIDFFEMSEICRPKFIVRHSTRCCFRHFQNSIKNESFGSVLYQFFLLFDCRLVKIYMLRNNSDKKYGNIQAVFENEINKYE
jgi:hypothetical protein